MTSIWMKKIVCNLGLDEGNVCDLDLDKGTICDLDLDKGNQGLLILEIELLSAKVKIQNQSLIDEYFVVPLLASFFFIFFFF